MKRKDLGLIGAVVVFSAVVSFVLATAFFSYDKGKGISVDKVSEISTTFVQKGTPDYATNYEPFFNENAINPTQLIKIGDGSNPAPL